MPQADNLEDTIFNYEESEVRVKTKYWYKNQANAFQRGKYCISSETTETWSLPQNLLQLLT